VYRRCIPVLLDGAVFWIDLSAGDPAFYTGLFGWTLGSDGVFACRGRVVAGYGAPAPPDHRPSWTAHLLVDDLDLAAARVAAGGGRVEHPRDTPLGRMAVVADPGGARFAVREAGRRAELVHQPGTLSWTELCTPDVAAARAFYVDQFGWDAVSTTMALPAGEVPYTVFCRGGAEVAGLMPTGGRSRRRRRRAGWRMSRSPTATPPRSGPATWAAACRCRRWTSRGSGGSRC
jgi:predicted enzyme related to lactoylglutathione lyase